MTVRDFTITLKDKKDKAKWIIPHYHKHTLEMILDKLGINTDCKLGEIEDDGETISSLCGAHKSLHDKKVEDATKHIGKVYIKWEEDIRHLDLFVLEKELLEAIKKDLGEG
ncbi:hypothetical protein LCGC14_1750440 [marine sediment metagenome]|uniref:Uncharacterized protein n=1 Tax=marine sediment metagenome TaxID=412755 RepID=A0A0F9HRE9_9ZZZZ